MEPLGNIVTAIKIDNTQNFILSLIGMLNIILKNKLYIIDTIGTLKINNDLNTNYYNDNFDNVLDKLSENIIMLKNNNEKGLLLIYGISKLVSKLSDSSKLKTIFNLIKEYEKIGVIIVDDASKIKNIMYENWFEIFDVTNGLWIGKGIMEQSLLRISNIYKDMKEEIKNDMGYIVKDGTTTLCKLIDFINREGE